MPSEAKEKKKKKNIVLINGAMLSGIEISFSKINSGTARAEEGSVNRLRFSGWKCKEARKVSYFPPVAAYILFQASSLPYWRKQTSSTPGPPLFPLVFAPVSLGALLY